MKIQQFCSGIANSSDQPKNYYFMNKSELVAGVQEHLGAETSKATAERAVEAVLERF